MALKIGSLYYDVTVDTDGMLRAEKAANQSLQRMTSSFTAVTIAVKALAAAYTLLKTAQLAEEMRILFSRVEIAAGSLEKASDAMRALQAISTKTQTSIAANASVFARLNSSLLQMGGTQQDTLKLTELLAQAVKVSGGTAQEASAAMLQFGQAMGSGKLAGDEFRSLMETAPYLMRQLADGIGVPIGALKQLAEDGKLTSDVVVEALGKAAGQIEADFERMPKTMAGAMQVAQDAAARLAESLDNVSGTSAALTGIAQGTGDVLDSLAARIAGVSTESDKLGRNDKIKTWADLSVQALSYVADAADFLKRAFQQAGTGLGGLAAAASAVVRGEFSSARDILKEMSADVVKIGSSQYAGAAMRQQREALATGTDGSDPMDRRARGGGAFSKLKPGGGAATGGKVGRANKDPAEGFDSEGYLAGLERATLDGLALVDAAEKEALRKNAELLTQRKIKADTAAKAVTLIERNAAQERIEIVERENKARIEAAARLAEEEAKAAKMAADARARGLQMAEEAAVVNDPIGQLELRLARELEMLNQYAAMDMANARLYADAKVALEEETALRIAEIHRREADRRQQNNLQIIGMAGDMAGQLLAIEESAGRERSALAKALFLTQKALAIAEIIINTERGAAAALAMGPAGVPLATMIRVSGYMSAGIAAGQAVAEVAGGRQYGGPVTAGELYRVNEGGRPEMFTAANGSQYMMPTADGNVTPSGRMGGGGQVINITQNFAFSSPTDPRTQQQLGAAAARGLQVAAARNN